MSLIIGENSYVSLDEIKSLCIDPAILSKSDDELTLLARKSFLHLEHNFILKYKKLNKGQKSNFPLSIHNDGEVPDQIKLAQVLLMSEVNTKKSDREVVEITVGDITKKYSNSKTIANEMNIVNNIMSEYTVVSLC